jgi:hypothetical protein
MKKLLMAVTMFLGFAAVTSAQTAVKKTETKTVAVKPATAPAKVVAMDKAKPATAKPAPAASTAKVKADGTPDMRYKDNKTTAKPVEGPKKADGTPDKRFKENKAPKS